MKWALIIGAVLLAGCYYPPPRYSAYPAYMPPPAGRYTYQPPTAYQPPSYVSPGQPEPEIVPPPFAGGEQPPLGNDGPINLNPPVQQTPLASPPSESIPPDVLPQSGPPIQRNLPADPDSTPVPPPTDEQRPVNPALELPDEPR
jgi:hypothetical protein